MICAQVALLDSNVHPKPCVHPNPCVVQRNDGSKGHAIAFMQDFVVGKTATVIPRLVKQIQFIVIDKTKKSGQPHQLWARRFVVERYAEFLLKEPHCAGVTGLLQVSPPCRTMD